MESLEQVLERHKPKSDIYFMLKPFLYSVLGRFLQITTYFIIITWRYNLVLSVEYLFTLGTEDIFPHKWSDFYKWVNYFEGLFIGSIIVRGDLL